MSEPLSMYETVMELGFAPLTFTQLAVLRRRFANDPKVAAFIAKHEKAKLEGLTEPNRPTSL